MPKNILVQKMLDGLNLEQRQAVCAPDGPILVVAGAGSGKTRVLTTRIARLLLEGVQPDRILAVTFTNKAAREMRERIATLVDPGLAARLWMGSFHGVSLSILRQHAQEAGLRSAGFRIADDQDQLAMMKKDAEALGFLGDLEGKELKETMRNFHGQIMGWKEEGWMPESVTHAPGFDGSEGVLESLALYRAYAARLLDRNTCDFADLLLHPLHLFRTRSDIRAQWSHRFDHVLVDEFQDTNQLQYQWLRVLATKGNLFAVGDIDQSIYEWRGARPDIMIGFSRNFSNTTQITIDRNYRSTQPILDVANAIVAHNPRIGEKTLHSGVAGGPVRVRVFAREVQEAEAVAQSIQSQLKQGVKADEVAVLFRSAAQMRGIEQELRKFAIPYEVVGGQRFDERMEVKDALAYLRLAVDPEDDEAFFRVANRPTRGLGPTSVSAIVGYRLRYGGTLAAAIRGVVGGKTVRVSAKAREGALRLAVLLDQLQALGEGKPGDVLQMAIKQSGYGPWIKAEDPDRGSSRVEVLEDMIAEGRSGRYATIGDWLQQIALLSAADQATDQLKVRLSTIHAAKGLEFDVVYTPCLEDGILPNARAQEASYGLSEERRIAHVAWTRARKGLIVTLSLSRHGKPQAPSNFLEEAGLSLPKTEGSPSRWGMREW